MTAHRSALEENAWTQIDRERRLDKRLRRLSVIAWTFTLLVMLVLVLLTALEVRIFWALGMVPWVINRTAMPLLIVLVVLGALIATLATVGIFLRLRTASLMEIQLRLAALEQMLTRDAGVAGESEGNSGAPNPS
jgi:cytochrome bd-type quinol oxidase subunit 2